MIPKYTLLVSVACYLCSSAAATIIIDEDSFKINMTVFLDVFCNAKEKTNDFTVGGKDGEAKVAPFTFLLANLFIGRGSRKCVEMRMIRDSRVSTALTYSKITCATKYTPNGKIARLKTLVSLTWDKDNGKCICSGASEHFGVKGSNIEYQADTHDVIDLDVKRYINHENVSLRGNIFNQGGVSWSSALLSCTLCLKAKGNLSIGKHRSEEHEIQYWTILGDIWISIFGKPAFQTVAHLRATYWIDFRRVFWLISSVLVELLGRNLPLYLRDQN